MVAVRGEHTNVDALLSSPIGFLGALEAQGELRELLDAVYGEALG
jgi:precorrin isomerase